MKESTNVKKFNQLGLSNEVFMATQDMEFDTATKIQQDSIPLILEGRDIIGHSQTGTGKTMAFGLPAIDLVNVKSRAVQVLVLCPTRELALQACGEIRKAAKYKPGINIVSIYGGAPIQNQTRELKKGAHIVVGTPGRIMDHMRRRSLKLGALKLAVLDEADEMLNMGFRDDMTTILSEVPEDVVTVLFSATMSKEIIKLTKNYQKNAKMVKSGDSNLTVRAIDQWYCNVSREKKTQAIEKLYLVHKPKMSLVFCNTKRMVDTLVERLNNLNITAVALHGDLNQNQRNRVMDGFRAGRYSMLVATDVAARGLDVEGVEMVFNYDIPLDNEYYIHRIGRTGRAGRSGKAVTFACGRGQVSKVKSLQKYISATIPCKKLPTVTEIEEINRKAMVEKIKEELTKNKDTNCSKVIDQLIDEGIDSKQIAVTLLKMLTGKSEQVKEKEETSKADFTNTGAERGMVRFFINLGKKDRVQPKDIVGCIAGETKVNGSEIGKIDVYDKFSFVEVPHDRANIVLETLGGVALKGRPINIEVAKGR